MATVFTNRVDRNKMREVQLDALEQISNILRCSFGPFGSNTLICAKNRYTKDGHTILSNIMMTDVIGKSVLDSIVDETSTQAIKIGDSTTSITLMSEKIFKLISDIESKEHIPPADIVKVFKRVAEDIKNEIMNHRCEATLEDLYNIALIATNGNEDLAKEVAVIYEEYGLDVYVDVKASVTGESYVKEIDGMVIDCGFLDPVFVNNTEKNSVEIHKPKVYAFDDPIDTPEMGMFFDLILTENILKPMSEKDFDNVVPTVIMAPKISRDYSAYLGQIMNYLAQAPSGGKGFLNIITDICSCDQDQYADIRDFCGCKSIKKYIDPEIQEDQIKRGLAPTPETIHDFAGSAELVSSDQGKTTFVNPSSMINEDGTFSDLYNQRIAYLENSIDTLKREGNDTREIYKFKKRLNSLKGKMVEVYIGGVTIADRDQARDLMEDAVLNCRSAAMSGVGYAANYEGFRACLNLLSINKRGGYDDFEYNILTGIYSAYNSLLEELYYTLVRDEDEAKRLVIDSIHNNCPYNLRTKSFDHKVLSSIETDVCSIDTIAKIVTIMATANQALLPSVNVNNY